MNTLKNLLSLNDDERLLAEVRTYQEKLISNAEEPIWERKVADNRRSRSIFRYRKNEVA